MGEALPPFWSSVGTCRFFVFFAPARWSTRRSTRARPHPAEPPPEPLQLPQGGHLRLSGTPQQTPHGRVRVGWSTCWWRYPFGLPPHPPSNARTQTPLRFLSLLCRGHARAHAPCRLRGLASWRPRPTWSPRPSASPPAPTFGLGGLAAAPPPHTNSRHPPPPALPHPRSP